MGLDYYGILELNRMASILDIKKAFRRLSLKYHPERFLDPKAQKIFEVICEAYDVLSCPKTRAFYDQFGEEAIKAGVPQPPGEGQQEGYFEVYTFHGDADKVFREFFGVDSPFADIFIPNIGPPGKFVGDDGRSKKQLGPTTEKQVPLCLEDIYYGCKKTVTLVQKKFDVDNHISKIVEKKYTFYVPSGCPNYRRFVFPGAGDEGPNIIPGDVIFVVKIEPDPRFRVEGNNLVVTKSLTLGHALTGSIIDVWTVDDKVLHVPVCGIMKPGHQLVISGEGLPIEGTQYKGDLIIEFQVDFPERISQEQKALIKKALLRTPLM